jgi:hypothetical protein
MASPVFEAMFNSPLFSEGADSITRITDSSPTVFGHFLE